MKYYGIGYRFLFLLMFVGVASVAGAQSFDAAKKLYSDGEYEKAEAAFKKLVKSSPSSAAYNYWYGITSMKLGERKDAEKYLKNAAKRKYTEAYRALGELYSDMYDFEASTEQYELYISQLDKAKKTKAAEKYRARLEEVKRASFMMRGVERVNVIDSIVVDKEDFLSVYKLSKEAGSLHYYNEFFGTSDEHYGVVYESQLGNSVIYGEKMQDGSMKICSSFLDDGKWSKPEVLPETVNKGQFQNYPYMLSDGLIVYYASMNDEGIGGYDIYVTAYNTNTYSYMQPQNIGMPFNSMYNDYMYVVDEHSGLGWFASDRFQPEGKVCIYVFVPNSEKVSYDPDNTDSDVLRKAASLVGFHDVQSDSDAVAVGLESLRNLLSGESDKPEKKIDFEFVIDDDRTYTNIYDFMSKTAQDLFVKWQADSAKLQELKDKLEQARVDYHNSDKAGRSKLENSILDMERRVGEQTKALKNLEVSIRNAEISKDL